MKTFKLNCNCKSIHKDTLKSVNANDFTNAFIEILDLYNKK